MLSLINILSKSDISYSLTTYDISVNDGDQYQEYILDNLRLVDLNSFGIVNKIHHERYLLIVYFTSSIFHESCLYEFS